VDSSWIGLLRLAGGDLVVALSQAQRQDNALLQSRVIEVSVLTVPQLDKPQLFRLKM
jgi:hypothetical protein